MSTKKFTTSDEKTRQRMIPKAFVYRSSARCTSEFLISIILVAMSFFAMMGVLFFLSFYLQSALDFSPLKAGLYMTPFALAQLIFSPMSAKLVQRFGARAVNR